MRGPRLAILPLVIGPALALLAATPAGAGTQPSGLRLPAMPTSHSRSTPTVPDRSNSAMAGFSQVGSDGTVNHFTSYNSAGGAITVSHTASTGVYDVLFHNLGFPGGDVSISPVNSNGTCAVNSWGPSGADLDVTVNCYDAAGAAADETFSVLVTQPHAHATLNGVFDYDWVFKNHGLLTGIYQFNSSHHTNSVKNPTVGHYIVTMPGPGPVGANKGTIKVSAYGPGAGSCQVVASHAIRIGEQIAVACFAANGVPQNRRFTVVYVRGNNLMGQNGKLDANASATGTAALYQPAFQFDSKSGARVTVIHLDRGLYEVVFAGTNPTHHFSGGFGNLQLTPVGSAFRRCGVALAPTHTPFAFVGCSNAAGSATNSGFIVQLVYN